MKIPLLLIISLVTVVLHAEEFIFPKELKLKAAFPSEAKVVRYATPSPNGEVQHTVVSYTKEGVRFALIVDTPIPKAAQKDAARALEIAKETVLAKPSVQLAIEEPIFIGGWKGKRYLFEEEGKSRIEQRLFIIDDSLYTFGAGAKWAVDFEAASKDFFASITTLK